MWVKLLPRVVYSICIFLLTCQMTPLYAAEKIPEKGVRWAAPLIEINNRVYTRVTVDGKDHLFLVDNGCRHTIIGTALAEQLQFKPQQQVTYVAAYNNGRDAELGILKSLLIGELEISDVLVRHSSMITTLSRRIKSNISGVIGYSSMLPLKTTLDFKKKTIFFSAPPIDNHGGAENSIRGNILPLSDSNPWNFSRHIFAVKVSINGEETDAFLDLGYPGSVITTVNPRSLKLSPHMSMKRISIEIFGYLGQARYNKAREIKVGEVGRKNVQVLYFKTDKIPPITILGVEFLKDFLVTFDFKNGRVIMEPYS